MEYLVSEGAGILEVTNDKPGGDPVYTKFTYVMDYEDRQWACYGPMNLVQYLILEQVRLESLRKEVGN